MNYLASPPDTPNVIACNASDTFTAWLSQAGSSVIISTYQASKVAIVGWNGEQATVLLRQFPKLVSREHNNNSFS